LHDLITIDAMPPGALTTAEIDATMEFAANEKSEATRAAYDSDWKQFVSWCASRGATALPAHPVGAYLSFLAAQRGLRASSIGRKAAAIGHRHNLAGFEPPTNIEAVKSVLRGIRRTLGTAPVQKQAAVASIIANMLDHCPDTITGIRDRALLAFGFASAMRRSEIAALMVDDVSEVPDGLRVLIRRSKTDQEGTGQEIAIPRGYRLRPVEHLTNWMQAASIVAGPLFRRIDNGVVHEDGMSRESIGRAVQRAARSVGLDPTKFAGHSLRSGYVTSAVEVGAPLPKIMEQTRHRSMDMIATYSRRANLFVDHSGAGFL
jgi:site-specific recombinase XerD